MESSEGGVTDYPCHYCGLVVSPTLHRAVVHAWRAHARLDYDAVRTPEGIYVGDELVLRKVGGVHVPCGAPEPTKKRRSSGATAVKKRRSDVPLDQRNAQIVAALEDGQELAAVAERFGLSVIRVRQIRWAALGQPEGYRSGRAAGTTCKRNHELTPENSMIRQTTKNGKVYTVRQCRECHNMRNAARRAQYAA